MSKRRRGGRHLISLGLLWFLESMCSHGDIAGNSSSCYFDLLHIVTGDGHHARGLVIRNETPMWGQLNHVIGRDRKDRG